MKATWAEFNYSLRRVCMATWLLLPNPSGQSHCPHHPLYLLLSVSLRIPHYLHHPSTNPFPHSQPATRIRQEAHRAQRHPWTAIAASLPHPARKHLRAHSNHHNTNADGSQTDVSQHQESTMDKPVRKHFRSPTCRTTRTTRAACGMPKPCSHQILRSRRPNGILRQTSSMITTS